MIIAERAGSALPPTPREAALKDAAVELEASFLSCMLKAAGLGETPSAFGGGAGEDQYASFLVSEQAKAIARTGGIGLAESLFQALKETAHD